MMVFYIIQPQIPGDCTSEYLEIRNGFSELGLLIGKYCKSNPPPLSLNTKAYTLWINFVKTEDSSTSFAATWTAETCKIGTSLVTPYSCYPSDLLQLYYAGEL